jgi:hypothetical protein
VSVIEFRAWIDPDSSFYNSDFAKQFHEARLRRSLKREDVAQTKAEEGSEAMLRWLIERDQNLPGYSKAPKDAAEKQQPIITIDALKGLIEIVKSIRGSEPPKEIEAA